MFPLTVAMLQIAPAGSVQEANLRFGIEACREARRRGADLALFPEMWNVGYGATPDGRLAFDDPRLVAIGSGSEFVRSFQSLAAELDLAIAITYLEEWPGKPRNTISINDRHGVIQLTYAKVHTCDFGREAMLTPGEAFGVVRLNTRNGDLTVGAMICYDREFPESARVLMLRGAELIVVPNACDIDQHRRGQLLARSFENMVAMAMSNYPAPIENGHSIAVDGMAYRDGRSRDIVVTEAGDTEGMVLATFDIGQLRAYRAFEVWGNAYRKPDRYGLISSSDVDDPFVRPNSRRTSGI